jgi:hypothetical protein
MFMKNGNPTQQCKWCTTRNLYHTQCSSPCFNCQHVATASVTTRPVHKTCLLPQHADRLRRPPCLRLNSQQERYALEQAAGTCIHHRTSSSAKIKITWR